MAALQISKELAGSIQNEARMRGVSIEHYLRVAIRRERVLSSRKIIEQEQEWWLTLPLNERAKYEGEYIAVHKQRLIDHDKDEAALYKRIREKYGKAPILVMPAEGPREIRIYSPRLVR